jgi:hypothetical protein
MDDVVVHLEEAAKFKQTKPETLRSDLEDKEGDLIALASNPHYAQDVKEVRATFERTWNSKEQAPEERGVKRVRAALKAAWDTLREHNPELPRN